MVAQGIFIPGLFLSHSILKGFFGIYHSSNPPSLPNSAFYEFIHQRLPNHDSEAMGERRELENRGATAGCLCWAEASQRHGIRVSWQRRQAAICLFSSVPFSGKKREEFRKGWRDEVSQSIQSLKSIILVGTVLPYMAPGETVELEDFQRGRAPSGYLERGHFRASIGAGPGPQLPGRPGLWHCWQAHG